MYRKKGQRQSKNVEVVYGISGGRAPVDSAGYNASLIPDLNYPVGIYPWQDATKVDPIRSKIDLMIALRAARGEVEPGLMPIRRKKRPLLY